MIKKLLFIVAFSFAFAAMAQVSFGGFPYNWEDKHVSSQISFNTMPVIDMEALAAEDAEEEAAAAKAAEEAAAAKAAEEAAEAQPVSE